MCHLLVVGCTNGGLSALGMDPYESTWYQYIWIDILDFNTDTNIFPQYMPISKLFNQYLADINLYDTDKPILSL